MKTFSKLHVVTKSIWASGVVFESRLFSLKSPKANMGVSGLHLRTLGDSGVLLYLKPKLATRFVT